MVIGICSDHAGLDYKSKLIAELNSKGIETKNFGTDSPESCDYSDFAHPMARAIEAGEFEAGIAICGTGNGMAITLNHHRGIRAGLAWNKEIAHLVKEHNNANVLVMPARFVDFNTILEMTTEWLNTEFAGGRHQRRIDKIIKTEE